MRVGKRLVETEGTARWWSIMDTLMTKAQGLNAPAKYLYGVIGLNGRRAIAPLTSDDKGNKVYTIAYKDIACVVSDSTSSCPDPSDKEALIRHLIAHQSVMEKVMAEHTIVPIRVGVRLGMAREVESVLESGYGEFSKRLKRFDGKVEADVTASWSDLNLVIKKIAEEDPEIREMKNKVSSLQAKDNLAERIKIGSMIKDALDRERERIRAEVKSALNGLASAAVDHGGADEKVVMSCAFLMEKEGVDAFFSVLDELNGRYQGALNIKCVSPLPPYSFSAMDIRKVGYEEVILAKETIGLGAEASTDDIREAYTRATLKYHPDTDRGNPALGHRFEEITKAYRLLKKYCQGRACSFKEEAFEGFFIVEPIDPH
ncbi:MAG: GvpL/GvpF family gas vesicle protein [Deltaproteobacteria bacterium]|nr:GvpL/GvpF family gas vesicle protein [Deltaproteobacteria bacterium]